MALRVTLAGRVGIEADSGEVAAAGLGRPGRLALAYLVCERHRSVPRDELAEVLWGEELPQSWDQMLRGVAFKLRATLSAAGLNPTQALSTASGAFRLFLPTDATVDVEEAAAALAGAEASLAAGYPGAARAQASSAVTIAARQFAPTIAGAWVERRQAELAELHLRALEALARAGAAEGDWAGAITAAEEVITAQPFRESAYLVLMDAHAGAGNRGEALGAYSRCREALVEELGVDPSPPTEVAYLRLLGDDPTPTGSVAPTALPLPAALAELPGAFLVGRHVEVEALDAALKRAGVEGRQGVLVGGEPGAGKTTLVAAAARAAHGAGARVLYGRCDEELGLAFQPFAQALGHYVATAPTAELKAHVAAHGGTLARLVPELTRRLPEVVAPPTTEVEADRWALFEAVADALARASAAATVVLVLDDLHWAAPATLALLRHLLADPDPAPVLILGTFRHTDIAPGSALAATLADLRRAPRVERINLGGLDADGVAAFLDAAGNGADHDGALAAALHAHTSGNPYFVGELLRHLAETGATYRRQAPWSYYADATGLDVPESVVEVVRRRLDRLSPSAVRALVLASVMGAEFDLEIVEQAEAQETDTVLDGLEEAQAAALVVEMGRPGHYRFAHALVRHAIYGRLGGARRARLHRQIGEALEARRANDPAWLHALAHHFSEAATAGCASKAADYGVAAARRAGSQAAWEEGLEIAEDALAALSLSESPDATRRCELLLVLAHLRGALAVGRDIDSVHEASLLAAVAARAAGSREHFVRAALSYNHPRTPGGDVGRRLAEEALAAAGDDPRLRSLALIALIQSQEIGDQSNDRLSREALHAARLSGDSRALFTALKARGQAVMTLPCPSEMLSLADEMLDLPGEERELGHRLRGIAMLRLGDREGFDESVREMTRAGAERRVWIVRELAQWWTVSSTLLDGRFTEAEALAHDYAAALGKPWEQSDFALCIGRSHWERGQLGKLHAVLKRVADGDRFRAVRPLLPLAALAAGERDEAERELDRQMAQRAAAPPSAVSPFVLAQLSEAASALAAVHHAADLYDALLPYAGTVITSSPSCITTGAADHHLGRLARILDRAHVAQQHLKAALTLERRLASPPLVANTEYEYGRVLLEGARQQDQSLAAELLSSALVTARRHGMVRLVGELGTLLAEHDKAS